MAGTIIYYLYFLYIHTAGKRQMDTHNGIISSGRQIFIAGQIGWDETCTFHTDYFADQADQALRNIISILNAADAVAEHNTRLTWFIIRKKEYLASLKSLGQKYRE